MVFQHSNTRCSSLSAVRSCWLLLPKVPWASPTEVCSAPLCEVWEVLQACGFGMMHLKQTPSHSLYWGEHHPLVDQIPRRQGLLWSLPGLWMFSVWTLFCFLVVWVEIHLPPHHSDSPFISETVCLRMVLKHLCGICLSLYRIRKKNNAIFLLVKIIYPKYFLPLCGSHSKVYWFTEHKNSLNAFF